jgi:hypothetical protein
MTRLERNIEFQMNYFGLFFNFIELNLVITINIQRVIYLLENKERFNINFING